jgi:hypothetical protein
LKLKVVIESAWAGAPTALLRATMIRILRASMRFVEKLLHFGDGADEQCTVSQQVIAGLDPAIHEAAQQTWNSIGFIWGTSSWMRGSSPRMTLSVWQHLTRPQRCFAPRPCFDCHTVGIIALEYAAARLT